MFLKGAEDVSVTAARGTEELHLSLKSLYIIKEA